MKNKYEKLLENIELKDDPKDQIRQAVYNYDEKEKLKYRNLKMVLAMCTALLLFTLPAYIINNNHKNEVSFSIKADDDVYQIRKGKVILKDLYLEEYNPLSIRKKFDEFEVVAEFAIPLSIYVEGENINSISYRLNSGTFVKLKETGEIIRSKGSTGFFTGKEYRPYTSLLEAGFNILGDSSKTMWEVMKSDSEITIPYEAQRTVDGLYGINLLIKDEESIKRLAEIDKMNSAEDWKKYSALHGIKIDEVDRKYDIEINLTREERDQIQLDIEKKLEKKLYESLKQLEMDIRVNYNDGTYEVTKVTFVIDENKNKIDIQNKND